MQALDRIHFLDTHQSGQLEASVTIKSLSDAVVGLLRSALDAGASSIMLEIDQAKGACAIKHNGSKSHTLEEPFLAALHHMSRLKIRSWCGSGIFDPAIRSSTETMSSEPKGSNPPMQHTHVIISKELFWNLPVRARHARAAVEAAAGSAWRDLLRSIAAQLLATRPVSLLLEKLPSHEKIHVHEQINQPYGTHWKHILTRFGIIDADTWTSWTPVSKASESASGFMSLDAATAKHTQFLSWKGYPLSQADSAQFLFDAVNDSVSQSSFGEVDRALGSNAYPMFCINLDTSFNPIAESAESLKVIHSLVVEWLQRHCFQRGRAAGQVGADVPEGHATDKPHLMWMHPPDCTDGRRRNEYLTKSRGMQRLPRSSTRPKTAPPAVSDPNKTENLAPHGVVLWKDHATGEIYDLDPLSGAMLPTSERVQPLAAPSPCRLKLNVREREHVETPTWLKDIVQNSSEPVFRVGESQVETVTRATEGPQSCALWTPIQIAKDALSNAEVIAQVDKKFILVKVHSRGSTQGPQRSLVLVDQHAADERVKVEMLFKDFTNANMQRNHAQTPQELYTSCDDSGAIRPPITFEMSTYDAAVARERAPYFAAWGVLYRVNDGERLSRDDRVSSSKYDKARVEVFDVPQIVKERCTSEPELVKALIRSGVGLRPGKKQSSTSLESKRMCDGQEKTWVDKLQGCPQGLIDMINSRACRSAIMFNDHLTQADCRNLIRQLGKCALPFQCAHGRPTLVPLTDLSKVIDETAVDAFDLGMCREV